MIRSGGRFAALALSAALAATSAAQPGSGPRAPSWPGDAELEAMGARIGTVSLRSLPIFEDDEDGEPNALFRFANRVHIDTRAAVIESQLLVQPGDLYSRQRLDETARNLRELRFIREPEVRIVGYHDGLVDLEVVTQEVWTTNPGISYGRRGGRSSTSIQLEEINLFGYGKHLAVDYSNDVDRSAYTVRWADPAIRGSRWRNELAYRDSDDGAGKSIVIERPFYALDTRWSTGIRSGHEQTIEPVYRLGQRVARYREDRELTEVRYGWSRGLQDGWTRRTIAGFRHERSRFAFAPDVEAPAILPGNRRLDYPFLRFEAVQDDFETARNRDQIARTEDFHFGVRYALELGLADPAFGSDRSAALIRAEASRGFHLDGGQSLFVHGNWSGRFERGAVADGLLSAGVRLYRASDPKKVFYAALGADLGHRLDADHELSIGGDNGLRGYPLRYQNGSSRALFTLERRYFTDWSIWKLASVGGAIFFDAGRSWGGSAFGPTGNQGLLKDVGIGLRLGSTRSSLANVLHVDLAFPLDGPHSIDQAQLLIETKGSF